MDQGTHCRHRGNVVVDSAENVQQMRMKLGVCAILWLMAKIGRLF
jgi:hypothetical protein